MPAAAGTSAPFARTASPWTARAWSSESVTPSANAADGRAAAHPRSAAASGKAVRADMRADATGAARRRSRPPGKGYGAGFEVEPLDSVPPVSGPPPAKPPPPASPTPPTLRFVLRDEELPPFDGWFERVVEGAFTNAPSAAGAEPADGAAGVAGFGFGIALTKAVAPEPRLVMSVGTAATVTVELVMTCGRANVGSGWSECTSGTSAR